VGLVTKGAFASIGGSSSGSGLPIIVCVNEVGVGQSSGLSLMEEGCAAVESFGERRPLTGRAGILPLGAAVTRGATGPTFLVRSSLVDTNRKVQAIVPYLL